MVSLEKNQASVLRVREFHFTDNDFEQVRQLIYEHAGISLAPIKRDMVYARLARRLRALGFQRFSDYLELLQREQSGEREFFINALTTNLTSFFREAHHFQVLADYLQAFPKTSPVRIWCAAASTGEEPYSLAMTACEVFNTLSPPVTILATDIDTHVLATASQGVYPLERVESLSPERLRTFFQKGAGRQLGNARVRPALQRLIQFSRLNLLDKHYALHEPFDVIFCRNVMIYFDRPTQYQILQKFMPLLQENGLLFAGHSENFVHAADLFRSLGKTVYERADRVR